MNNHNHSSGIHNQNFRPYIKEYFRGDLLQNKLNFFLSNRHNRILGALNDDYQQKLMLRFL